jgi:hypothetical protein
VSAGWSVCRGDLGDGGPGGCVVDEVLAGDGRGDQGGDADVVDGSRLAAGGGVDLGDGVVGEQVGGAVGFLGVVADADLTSGGQRSTPGSMRMDASLPNALGRGLGCPYGRMQANSMLEDRLRTMTVIVHPDHVRLHLSRLDTVPVVADCDAGRVPIAWAYFSGDATRRSCPSGSCAGLPVLAVRRARRRWPALWLPREAAAVLRPRVGRG